MNYKTLAIDLLDAARHDLLNAETLELHLATAYHTGWQTCAKTHADNIGQDNERPLHGTTQPVD